MKRAVLTSALLSCAVFSCLTAPLAVFGSNLIDIEYQRENIFVGRLKDIATPYLGLAGLISVGAGAVSFCVSEWRRSAQKSTQIETQLVELKNELQEKSTQIDDLRLADSYLSAHGFQAFLDTEDSQSHSVPVTVSQARVVQPSKAPMPTSFSEEKIGSHPLHTILDTHAAEMPKARFALDRKPESTKRAEPEVLSHLAELQNQIKQIESHIQTLQSSLPAPVAVVEHDNPYNLELQRLHRRLQLLELDWLRHQTAS